MLSRNQPNPIIFVSYGPELWELLKWILAAVVILSERSVIQDLMFSNLLSWSNWAKAMHISCLKMKVQCSCAVLFTWGYNLWFYNNYIHCLSSYSCINLASFWSALYKFYPVNYPENSLFNTLHALLFPIYTEMSYFPALEKWHVKLHPFTFFFNKSVH